MTGSVPLFEIDWDHHEIRNAVDSICRGSYWAKGPYVEEFENRLEAYYDVNHAVVVNSGTTALVGALTALGVGPGDAVVVPSFTFIATANAVRLVGATPVFADIDRETYGLDPADVERKITPDTEAILPVHPYGSACRIDELVSLARDHDVSLVEDAAEAFGCEYDGQLLGTFGEAAALSFCQNKVVTTGEGGAVITDDPKIADAARLYRSHGRSSEGYFERTDSGTYTTLGTNVRMSDLVASIGCAQMEKADELIAGRRRVAAQYDEALRGVPDVAPHPYPALSKHVYQLYTVELAETVDRAALVKVLDDHGVSCKVYWDPPVHRTEFYGANVSLAVTDEVASRVLTLPMHPNLSVKEVERVVSALEVGIEKAK
ncbi:MAG: DegT/DnrJ/EryC1/StrS family aminotransferase [Haloferacaceae archaeon]